MAVTLCSGLNLSEKPTLSDFQDPEVQSLLSKAIRHYESMIITKGPFPDHVVQAQRVRACWDRVQANNDQKSEDGSPLVYELTERMTRLVKKRGSRVRSLFLKDARNAVKTRFGLTKGDGPRRAAKNLSIVATLISGDKYSFHYKDPKARTGYCENPAIIDILAEVCFCDEEGFGIIYKEDFSPISIETLAFVFTLLYFAITEWSTGSWSKVNFTEALLDKHYKVFRADLLKWAKLNEVATTLKRKKMYERACKRGGVSVSGELKPQLEGEDEDNALRELEGYTGETETSDDGGNSVDDEDVE
ncbi:hypothetical protein H0H92_011826 [Tricholoma furcatifolium]|nr:hypothetical protein H0H92_011826 [Tricholoma furcatifolium]